jgi:hypothetical protein
MKGIIKKLLRENLLAEMGDSKILPFEIAEQNDHLQGGIPVLDDIVYFFQVKNEQIYVQSKLERGRPEGDKTYLDYSVVFTLNGVYEKSNDMSTLLPKMSTIFSGILPSFINLFNKQYVTKKTDIGLIYFYGIGDDDKGEDVSSEELTKRTKLYSYFFNKNTPPGFSAHQTGNTFYYAKN